MYKLTFSALIEYDGATFRSHLNLSTKFVLSQLLVIFIENMKRVPTESSASKWVTQQKIMLF